MALDENKIIAEIADYRTSSALFGNKLLWANKSISPVTWWKAFCSDTVLSNVAITILNFPPTSASVERSFSRQSYIHSKTRNRLTNDKVEKLVFVSHNLDFDIGNLKVRRLKHIAAPEANSSPSGDENTSNDEQELMDIEIDVGESIEDESGLPESSLNPEIELNNAASTSKEPAISSQSMVANLVGVPVPRTNEKTISMIDLLESSSLLVTKNLKSKKR